MKRTDRIEWSLLAGCISVAIGLSAALIPEYIPLCLLLLCLAAILSALLLHPAWLLFSIAIVAPTVFIFRQLESINLLGTTVSGSGILWAFIACACVWFLGSHLSEVRLPRVFLPFLAFTSWTLVRWLTSPLRLTGLKDVLFYGLPPLFACFTYWIINRYGAALMRKVESLFILSLIIPASVILFAIPMGWLIFTYRGPIGVVEGMSGIVEPRGTALYLLIVLTLALSRRQYAADIAEKRRMGIVALMALAILFFTLSRMAGFTALVLLALAFVKPHRAGRALLGVAAAALLGAAIVLSVPFLQDRFFSNPSADIWSTLSSLRLAGRDLSWRVTFENALRSPLVGWGPGSARLTVATFHKAADVTEFQPHNEYLQVFHDTGIIGLGLLLAGYVPLLFRFHKEWKKNHLLKNEPRAMRNMAAFFSLIAILLPSVTSNPMHFAFITEPVARVKQISGIAVKPASPFRRFSVLHSSLRYIPTMESQCPTISVPSTAIRTTCCPFP